MGPTRENDDARGGLVRSRIRVPLLGDADHDNRTAQTLVSFQSVTSSILLSSNERLT